MCVREPKRRRNEEPKGKVAISIQDHAVAQPKAFTHTHIFVTHNSKAPLLFWFYYASENWFFSVCFVLVLYRPFRFALLRIPLQVNTIRCAKRSKLKIPELLKYDSGDDNYLFMSMSNRNCAKVENGFCSTGYWNLSFMRFLCIEHRARLEWLFKIDRMKNEIVKIEEWFRWKQHCMPFILRTQPVHSAVDPVRLYCPNKLKNICRSFVPGANIYFIRAKNIYLSREPWWTIKPCKHASNINIQTHIQPSDQKKETTTHET